MEAGWLNTHSYLEFQSLCRGTEASSWWKETMERNSRILIKCPLLLCLLGSSSYTHPPGIWQRNFQPSSNSPSKLPTAWIWILLIQDQCCAWEQYSPKYIWSWWSTQLSPSPMKYILLYQSSFAVSCHKHSSVPLAQDTAPTSRGLALAEAGPSPCLEAVTNPGTQLAANLPLLLTELTHTLLPHKQLQEGTSQTEGQQKAVWIHVYWSQ